MIRNGKVNVRSIVWPRTLTRRKDTREREGRRGRFAVTGAAGDPFPLVMNNNVR